VLSSPRAERTTYLRAIYAVESSSLLEGTNVHWKLFSKRHEHSRSVRMQWHGPSRASPHPLSILPA
jgi:hypothetical protein